MASKTRQPTWRMSKDLLTSRDRTQLRDQALQHGVRLCGYHVKILEALAIATVDSVMIELQTRHWWENE